MIRTRFTHGLNDENINLYEFDNRYKLYDWVVHNNFRNEVYFPNNLITESRFVFVSPDEDGMYYISKEFYPERPNYIREYGGSVITSGFKYREDVSGWRVLIHYKHVNKLIDVVIGDSIYGLTPEPIQTKSYNADRSVIDMYLLPKVDVFHLLPHKVGPSGLIMNRFNLSYSDRVFEADPSDIDISGLYVKFEKVDGYIYKCPRFLEYDFSDIKKTDGSSIDAVEYRFYGRMGRAYLNFGSYRPDIVYVKVNSVEGIIGRIEINPFVLFHSNIRYPFHGILVGYVEHDPNFIVYKSVYDVLGYIYDFRTGEVVHIDESYIKWVSALKYENISMDLNVKSIKELGGVKYVSS